VSERAVLCLTILSIISCVPAASKPCVASGPRIQSVGPAALPKVYETLPKAGFGAIIGDVSDRETGEGISTAYVILSKGRNEPPLKIASADTLGGFLLKDIEPGTYLLEVRGLTYNSSTFDFNARPATLDTFRVTLRFNPRYLSCATVKTS
jgi:hypothetical protein